MLPGFARFSVWAVTGLLLLAALTSMVVWTYNIGMHEDFFMAAPLTGHEPNLLAWLWSQNNEHRLPVQRMVYLGLLMLTGDVRSGMVLSQLTLALLSILLARAAAVARNGNIRISDIVFPLALLHLGHREKPALGMAIPIRLVNLPVRALACGNPSSRRLPRPSTEHTCRSHPVPLASFGSKWDRHSTRNGALGGAFRYT